MFNYKMGCSTIKSISFKMFSADFYSLSKINNLLINSIERGVLYIFTKRKLDPKNEKGISSERA